MRSRWHRRDGVWACLVGAAISPLAACDWTQLDAIAQPSGAVILGPTSDPDASGDGGAADAPPVEAAVPSPTCASSAAPVREWTFNATVENWTASLDNGAQATIGWNGNVGDPSPGALEADVTPAQGNAGAISGAWVVDNMPSPIDLSGRTLAAWVRLESGAPPHLKMMAQTGSQYAWADNGTVYLAPHVWTCVLLELSAPAYAQPNYDPAQVVRIGFEMLSTTPFVLSIDSVRYN